MSLALKISNSLKAPAQVFEIYPGEF